MVWTGRVMLPFCIENNLKPKKKKLYNLFFWNKETLEYSVILNHNDESVMCIWCGRGTAEIILH